MASRADLLQSTAPPASTGPTFGGALREALSDLYFHSWRLVPANVVWAVVLIGVLIAVILTPLGLLALPLLAFPTAGLFRMAGRIARGESVSFWDSIAAWRSDRGATLVLGAGLAVAAVVLGVNAVSGLLTGSLLGWAFATLAFWGLVAGWLFAWTAWPIVTDPYRREWPVRPRLELAALLLLAHPVRLAILGIALAAFLAASTVAIVALLTVSVAVAAVVAARYVLPAADRLDTRLSFGATRRLPPPPEADEE